MTLASSSRPSVLFTPKTVYAPVAETRRPSTLFNLNAYSDLQVALVKMAAKFRIMAFRLPGLYDRGGGLRTFVSTVAQLPIRDKAECLNWSSIQQLSSSIEQVLWRWRRFIRFLWRMSSSLQITFYDGWKKWLRTIKSILDLINLQYLGISSRALEHQ